MQGPGQRWKRKGRGKDRAARPRDGANVICKRVTGNHQRISVYHPTVQRRVSCFMFFVSRSSSAGIFTCTCTTLSLPPFYKTSISVVLWLQCTLSFQLSSFFVPHRPRHCLNAALVCNLVEDRTGFQHQPCPHPLSQPQPRPTHIRH